MTKDTEIEICKIKISIILEEDGMTPKKSLDLANKIMSKKHLHASMKTLNSTGVKTSAKRKIHKVLSRFYKNNKVYIL